MRLSSVESSQTGLAMGWVLSAPQGVMVWASLGTLYSALKVYESHAKDLQSAACYLLHSLRTSLPTGEQREIRFMLQGVKVAV